MLWSFNCFHHSSSYNSEIQKSKWTSEYFSPSFLSQQTLQDLTKISLWGEAVMNHLYYITMYERKIVCSWFNNVWFKSEENYIQRISQLYSVSMCSVELVIELYNEPSESLTYTEMNKWLIKHMCTFPTSEYTFRTFKHTWNNK